MLLIRILSFFLTKVQLSQLKSIYYRLVFQARMVIFWYLVRKSIVYSYFLLFSLVEIFINGVQMKNFSKTSSIQFSKQVALFIFDLFKKCISINNSCVRFLAGIMSDSCRSASAVRKHFIELVEQEYPEKKDSLTEFKCQLHSLVRSNSKL